MSPAFHEESQADFFISIFKNMSLERLGGLSKAVQQVSVKSSDTNPKFFPLLAWKIIDWFIRIFPITKAPRQILPLQKGIPDISHDLTHNF